MKINKKIALSSVVVLIALLSGYVVYFENAPIAHKQITTDTAGDVVIAQPMWNASGAALVFVDTHQYPANKLAEHLASLGMVAAVIDAHPFFSHLVAENKSCIRAAQVAESITALLEAVAFSADRPFFITGIADGAMVPFLNAQTDTLKNAINLSVGFTVNVPSDLVLCPPLTTIVKDQQQLLVSAPGIKTNWRTAWNDRPIKENGVFIKENVPHADTNIVAYHTPLDSLLASELILKLGQATNQLPMPTIENPTPKKTEVVTLFYSGDGGWRDLDKIVANEMVKSNYPVIGVDVMRYFWERKTPEQVTADLSATMAYYRKNWGVKAFVLAGFSFGADILPVLYNRLSETDKASVPMLVFLALGNHADFEVKVAGWLGQTTHEMPLDVELDKLNKNKILCIYGKEEKAKTGTACTFLEKTAATVIELPGGHHFDDDYPKLTKLILDNYRQHGVF